jgi:hypothetical protein
MGDFIPKKAAFLSHFGEKAAIPFRPNAGRREVREVKGQGKTIRDIGGLPLARILPISMAETKKLAKK